MLKVEKFSLASIAEANMISSLGFRIGIGEEILGRGATSSSRRLLIANLRPDFDSLKRFFSLSSYSSKTASPMTRVFKEFLDLMWFTRSKQMPFFRYALRRTLVSKNTLTKLVNSFSYWAF